MALISSNYEIYLSSLPIPREVVVGDLKLDERKQITQTVFIEPDFHSADLLFIFGTSYIDNEILEVLSVDCNQGLFPKVLVTGKVPYTDVGGRMQYETEKPVASIMCDELVVRGVPSDRILVQDRSTNTLEDVQFSLDILSEYNVSPRTIAFLCKAHHSGRCLRTLRKFFPLHPLWPITYEAQYGGVRVSKNDWYDHSVSRGRVYGEYLRILKYTAKKDIVSL